MPVDENGYYGTLGNTIAPPSMLMKKLKLGIGRCHQIVITHDGPA